MKLNVSEPAVSEYLRDFFPAKGQRDVWRGTTPEKREMGGERGWSRNEGLG